VFVVPCDQPLVAADDLTELIGAFKKRPGGHVIVPYVEGRRGNPILLDAQALAQILDSGVNLGCRHLIDRHPELVHVHTTGNMRFVSDLDTLEDVQALAARTGWRLELPA
jgi:CTP:molybdopterin cytidylyltransferase MocA